MSSPKISLVIVNFRNNQDTFELLHNLRDIPYKELEVILVDTGIHQSQESEFLKVFPGLNYLHRKQNLGYAGAHNLGIKQCTGELIMLLNNDTWIPIDFFEKITECFNNTSLEVISPIIRFYDSPETIQFSGYSRISSFTGRNRVLELSNNEEIIQKTAYIHGAACIFRRSVLSKVELLSEDYFLYYEELDWSEKMLRKGVKIGLSLNTYVLHKESKSIGKSSPLKTYYMNRNRLLFMKRNFDNTNFIIFLLFYYFISLPKEIMKYVIQSNFLMIRVLLLSIIDFTKQEFKKPEELFFNR